MARTIKQRKIRDGSRARLRKLKTDLRNAQVAQDTGDRVGIGKHVTVKDENGIEKTYRLVSSHEANPSLGYISDQSPIGGALMGSPSGRHGPGTDTRTRPHLHRRRSEIAVSILCNGKWEGLAALSRPWNSVRGAPVKGWPAGGKGRTSPLLSGDPAPLLLADLDDGTVQHG